MTLLSVFCVPPVRLAVPSGGPAVSFGAFSCPIRRPSLRSSLPLRFACGPLPFMWPWAATGPGWDSRTRLRHPACSENLRTCVILFSVDPFVPATSCSLWATSRQLPRQKIILAFFDLAVVVFPRLKIILGLRKRCFRCLDCRCNPC